jgi:O-antigen ligase
MALASFVTFSTLSRANILGLIIFWYVFFCFKKTFKQAILLLLVFTVICVSSLQIKPVRDKVSDAVKKITLVKELTANRAVPARTRTWVASINIVRDHPWFGVGYSSAEDYLGQYGSLAYRPWGEIIIVSLHGGFLKFLVYGGLFTLGVFLYFYKTLISIAIKTWRSAADDFQSCAGYHLVMLLLVLIPMNIAADNFGLGITWIFVFYLLTNAIEFPGEMNFESQTASAVNAM